jgi:hypothetical protein
MWLSTTWPAFGTSVWHATAPVFRLLALDGTEVIDALGELNRQGELRFRMQADVIELEIGGAE